MRELGTIDAAMIVVGSMIGSGIFITSAESGAVRGGAGLAARGMGPGGADDDHRFPLRAPRSPR